MTTTTSIGVGAAASMAVILSAASGGDPAPGAQAAAQTPAPAQATTAGHGLLLAMALFGENEDGSPKPLPARMGILTNDNGTWSYGWFDDPESNVFHKAMAYSPAGGPAGILTLGGSAAAVKLWNAAGQSETLWEADFGGTFSRMRDAEVGDIYGDGTSAIAVATHDQGVVAVLRPGASGGFTVEELDRRANTIVHEIELGDLDGDGVIEIYATPTAPNQVDGKPQPGSVVRYVPALKQGPVEVADLGYRHAKEILVADIDRSGRPELYVSVEGVAGGKVEIRRYEAGTDPKKGVIVATLPGKLCRFLTAGDVDGDGDIEMVAATHKNGLWLLLPGPETWEIELIDRDSSSFEHASILLDLDGDGRDELYVASDNEAEVRRYAWGAERWDKEVVLKHAEGFAGFTWNIMPAPAALLPGVAATPVPVAEAEPEEERGLLVNTARAAPGYVLFSPILSDTTYLIDADGMVVHMWQGEYAPGASVDVLYDGRLLRTGRMPDVPVFKGGGQGGRIQLFTWEGELVWDFVLANEERLTHHDVEWLPNGNVLAIAWEAKSPEEALRAGRRPHLVPEKGLWPDMIVELEPLPPDDARIVWEWHMWDHMVQDQDPDLANYGDPSKHPHRIDINGDGEPEQMDDEELKRLKALGYVPMDATREELRSDLLHTNAVAYNPALDQIALSVPRFDEIWIIDHGLTTQGAAGGSGGRFGRGGDLLYRWGNPRAYGRGGEADQMLFGQHDVRWISGDMPGGGHLTVFNNNYRNMSNAGIVAEKNAEKDAEYSAVFEIVAPADGEGRYRSPEEGPFGPAAPLWRYEAPGSFHANFISGAHRLANGHTLITDGPAGRFLEVTPEGEIVWEYKTIYSGNVRNPDGSPPHPVGKNTFAVFRATKLPPDHPALAGRDLKPLDPQPPVIMPDTRAPRQR